MISGSAARRAPGYMELECAPISLERSLRSLARRHERLEGREELVGDLAERDLRRRRDLATPQLREELIPLRLRLGPRSSVERLHPPHAVRVGIADLVAASTRLLARARRGCRRYERAGPYYARFASGLTSWCRAPGGVTPRGGFVVRARHGRSSWVVSQLPVRTQWSSSVTENRKPAVLGAVKRDPASFHECADRIGRMPR